MIGRSYKRAIVPLERPIISVNMYYEGAYYNANTLELVYTNSRTI